MKKILLLVIIFLALLILINQKDDDLSIEAEQLISKVSTPGESISYLYLLGFNANENTDPKKLGSALLEEYRKFDADKKYEINKDLESNVMPLPEGEFFCKAWEDSCLHTLFNSEIDTKKLQADHKVLVARSNIFHEFSEYKTLTKSSAYEQFPPFQYIMAAERIKVLIAIRTYQEGKVEQAILALEHQISQMRHSLELQDNLIGKLVFLIKLSEIIDVLSIITYKSEFKTKKIDQLKPSEKDFSIVSAREFGMSYNTFKELNRHPEFFQIGGNFPGWMSRTIYKPNMTRNAIVPIYSDLTRLSLLTPDQFTKEVEGGKKVTISTSKIRNYVGNVLITMSPEYETYVARFMDFEAKIVLFNHLHKGFDTAINPYYKGETPEVFENKVCFNGPLKDERFLRCLRTKI